MTRPEDIPQWAWDEAYGQAILYVQWLVPGPSEYVQAEYVLAQTIARAILKAREEAFDWLPLETAPKDGTRVLCWNEEWQAPESGCRYGPSWAANGLAADRGGWKYQPTYWMPLPEPPAIRLHSQKGEK